MDSKTLQRVLGGAIALGGLGFKLYNSYTGSKRIRRYTLSLQNYNGRLRNAGLSASDPALVSMLKQEMGAKVPVAVISDKQKIKELGIGNNAFFAPPSVSGKYCE